MAARPSRALLRLRPGPLRDARGVGVLPRVAAPRGRGHIAVSAPERTLKTSRGELRLGGRPWLMGIVNATPDSFSDAGRYQTLDERVRLARSLLDDGAEVIDIGGESGVTNRPAVEPVQEIERVVPLIER